MPAGDRVPLEPVDLSKAAFPDVRVLSLRRAPTATRSPDPCRLGGSQEPLQPGAPAIPKTRRNQFSKAGLLQCNRGMRVAGHKDGDELAVLRLVPDHQHAIACTTPGCDQADKRARVAVRRELRRALAPVLGAQLLRDDLGGLDGATVGTGQDQVKGETERAHPPHHAPQLLLDLPRSAAGRCRVGHPRFPVSPRWRGGEPRVPFNPPDTCRLGAPWRPTGDRAGRT